MDIFYSNTVQVDRILLSEEEGRHCTKVMRKAVGDHIEVIDGMGSLFRGSIEHIRKNNEVTVAIEKKEYFEPQSCFHLGIAPTKSADRMEWLVEKTTELGIGSITFLNCEHSERSHQRLERLEKIAIAALKQSRQYWKPQINKSIAFDSFVKSLPSSANRYLAYCGDIEKSEFKPEVGSLDTFVLIGPEGDFSVAEVNFALAHGLKPVSLGQSRLRTETAAMHACSVYRSILKQH